MDERRVFIAIDGSKPAQMAFDWYLSNFKRDNDLVFLVHSAEYNVDIGLPGMATNYEAIGQEVKKEDDRITNMTGRYLQDLKKLTIHAKTLVPKGKKPGEAIVEAATKENANCIIMGSRGLGKIRRTLMGSVSEYVLHHAPPNCSVTILRDS